ncbi:uncharacterized protein B0I36DRAFT_389651 [Microdochium trichocladiopsis]|uniref:Fungal-type protein kinase domain-containing protein n=1 Tax=Microdochium trichocladiopsis TaxID=1682393 RepID=A0A9P8XUM2_9PEZI|nr:uncharacterized protein B0I36DRAFT_389651 [Microdochium trichocladiopsis]KAH7012755.1 hypothetical protein B0I36DRAFT_389651 [Microdochium trichocladiopsis]
MALSEDQIKIIAENPLDEALKDVRVKLRDCADVLKGGIVANLLGALVTSSAAFNLPAPDRSGNVAGKLFTIQQSVRGGSLKLEQFRPLIDIVVATSLDTEVWVVVIDLIEAVKPSTPPPSSIIPAFFGTPAKTSSSRLDDSETRDIVERELFFEIKDYMHRGVPGFFEKHFDSATRDEKHRQMLKLTLANHDGSHWKGFPTDPWEKPVWEWLVALEESSLTGAPYTLHATRTATEFKERKGQMDVFFQRTKSGNRRSTFKDVLVVGEHKRSSNSSDFKACLLQLTRHVVRVCQTCTIQGFSAMLDATATAATPSTSGGEGRPFRFVYVSGMGAEPDQTFVGPAYSGAPNAVLRSPEARLCEDLSSGTSTQLHDEHSMAIAGTETTVGSSLLNINGGNRLLYPSPGELVNKHVPKHDRKQVKRRQRGSAGSKKARNRGVNAQKAICDSCERESGSRSELTHASDGMRSRILARKLESKT